MKLGSINIKHEETSLTQKEEEIKATMKLYADCMSCTKNVKLINVKKWQQEP